MWQYIIFKRTNYSTLYLYRIIDSISCLIHSITLRIKFWNYISYSLPIYQYLVLHISDISLNEMSITNTFIYVSRLTSGVLEQQSSQHISPKLSTHIVFSLFLLSNFNTHTHTRERMNSTFMNAFIFPEMYNYFVWNILAILIMYYTTSCN